MARAEKDYPATLEKVQSILLARLAGTKAAYRARFRLIGPHRVDGRDTPIEGECAKHRLRFSTTGRYLFTVSRKSIPSTCLVCDYEHGYRRTRPWTEDRVESGLRSIDHTWQIIRSTVDEDRVLAMSDTVLLACQATAPDGRVCVGPGGQPTKHTVKNVSTLITRDRSHIACQGACEQRAKGKSSRLDEAAMAERLAERGSEWTVMPLGAQRVSDNFSIRHRECGVQVIRTGFSLKLKDPDCPLCSNRVVGQPLAHPQRDAPRILTVLSGGQFVFRADIDPPDVFRKADPLLVVCNTCGAECAPTVYEIRNHKHRGCDSCARLAAKNMSDTDWFQADVQALPPGRGRDKAVAAQDMQRRIEELGGRLAKDAVYVDSRTRVDAVCARNHAMRIARDKLMQGAWCAECHVTERFVVESITRRALELIFGLQFRKRRPEWLVNPETSAPLELDGITDCETLAYEHHGAQHRLFVPHWHRTRKEFDAMKRRDKYVEQLARERGVNLITVWEVNRGWPKDRILDHVEDAIRSAGVTVPSYDRSAFVVADLYSSNPIHDKAREFVRARGGALLSQLGDVGHLVDVSCAVASHPSWSTCLASIMYQDTWCPRCGDEAVSAKALAAAQQQLDIWIKTHPSVSVEIPGGVFAGCGQTLQITCERGHAHRYTFTRLKSLCSDHAGDWCPGCRKKTLQDAALVRRVAEIEVLCSRLELTLLTRPHTPRGRFRVACIKSGHPNTQTYYTLGAADALPANKCPDRGCVYCRGTHNKTIEDARRLAAELGGTFDDTEFRSVKQIYRWTFDGVAVIRTYDALLGTRRRNEDRLGTGWKYAPDRKMPWTTWHMAQVGALVGLTLESGQVARGIHAKYRWAESAEPLSMNAVEIRARKAHGRLAIRKIRASSGESG